MPIYKATIAGLDKPRLVKAESAAKARDHIVSTEIVTAEEMVDLIEAGAVVEKAAEKPAPAEPAKQPELGVTTEQAEA